jgi:hypothetical protein
MLEFASASSTHAYITKVNMPGFTCHLDVYTVKVYLPYSDEEYRPSRLAKREQTFGKTQYH